MERVLVDSNIFLDYYLDRKDSMLPLGEFAFQFIQKAIGCKYFLFVCREVIEEISIVLKMDEQAIFKNILKELTKKNKVGIIDPSPKLKKEARWISKTKNVPFNDALFAIVAREKNVPVVTRDKHFLELKGIAEIIKPEELQ